MAYKILAFDIDGTLTNSQKIITEETKRAIFAAMDKGCKVLIASGRPVKGLRGYAEELHLKENGGYILSLNDNVLCRWKGTLWCKGTKKILQGNIWTF